jgi:hypothetical protein
MNELDEPDEISRELDAIMAEYFGPPTEMDLRGVDPATFALGLSYGFDTWQHVRVVANNRRNVAVAARHWAEHHPSREFLSHVVGADERARGHRQLLNRAHPGCDVCEEQLQRLSAFDPDPVDPGGLPDDTDFELEWLLFQFAAATRSETAVSDISGPLQIDWVDGQPITAEHYGGRDWRITVRHPRARRATVWIGWTGDQVTEHSVTFENDLADIDVEAPESGTRPEKVRVKITDAPESP